MHALPFLIALASAAILARALLRALETGGHRRANYRGRALPFPFGVLTLAAALIALIPLMLLQRLASTAVFHAETLPIALYALGVLALGLIDDTLASDRSAEEASGALQRGWRGHGAAAMRGELSTGALKAAGSPRRAGGRAPARLARARRGGYAWRALHGRAEGRGIARPGAAGDEFARPLQRALAAGGGGAEMGRASGRERCSNRR